MIVCIQCGFENPDRHKFCQNCGFHFASESASKETSKGVSTTLQIDPVAKTQSICWQDDTDDDINADCIETDDIDVDDIHNISGFHAFRDSAEPKDDRKDDDSIDSDLAIADLVENFATDLAIDTSDIGNLTDPNDINSSNINFSNLQDQSATPQLSTEAPIAATLDSQARGGVTQRKLHLTSMKHAGLTDVGKQRQHNEDNFTICSQITTTETPNRGTLATSRGLFVLCDGMGGHAGGEVASSMAIKTIMEKFRPFWVDRLPGANKLREIIHAANQSIYELNESELRRDVGRMGTTLAILAVYDSEVAIAHVGDSRIYQITASGLKQITRDHEVANRLIDRGIDPVEANSRYDARQLTQALGPYANFQVDPTIAFFELYEPTLFLLCSDGLCDNDLVEQNWETYLRPLLVADADLGGGVKKLIDLGNAINGHDNITAILVNCQVQMDNDLSQSASTNTDKS